MKILELTRSFYPSIGGMEKFVDDRLKIYEALGYSYKVVTTTHSEKQLSNSKQYENVIYLPIYTPYGVVSNLEKAMSDDFDILSINQANFFYAFQAIKLAVGKNKKIILTPHFYFHTNRFKLIKDFHYKFILPTIINKANSIICFTEYEKDFWTNNLPESEKKISIIPHYFSPPIKKGKNIITKYGKFLLYVGRGEKNKRIDLLIEAFHKIDTNYNLVLTVDFDEISLKLKKIVRDDNRIHLLGRVSETKKQNLLASCEALVLPTEYEAFGIVNFEASHYSKPLLLTELSIFKNILNCKGVLYFNNELKSMEACIVKFLSLTETQKEEMGEINSENLKNYSFQSIVEMYLKLLQELQ